MSDNKLRIPIGVYIVVSLATAVHLGAVNGAAQVTTDVVFLIDGSDSVDECLFEFEKEALGTLICGSDCASCSDVNIPLDGTIAIGVVQFAGRAENLVPFPVIGFRAGRRVP